MFSGSCHCGAVAFTVDADLPTEALSCNCSICHRKGLMLAFFPATAFTLDRGEEALESYLFNAHKIAHQFCTTCGVEPFASGASPDGEMRAVNLRCVPVDLETLTIRYHDGASA